MNQPPRCGRRDVLGLLAAAVGGALATPAHADEGLRLATLLHDRPSGRDATAATRMELVDKNGSRRVRELVSYRLERGKGDFANMIRFLNPPDIAGVGLLSLDKPDGSNEQWLYLPELDRVRRVAGERKGGRFVGSDIYFEDLQTRKPSADQHRVLRQDSQGGVACQVLESVPVEAGNSTYRKRLVWVDVPNAMAMRVDYFEKSDSEPSKRWLLLARKEIQGILTVTDSKTVDLATGHETRLLVESVKYDRRLPARLFSSQMLADDSLESRYRP